MPADKNYSDKDYYDSVICEYNDADREYHNHYHDDDDYSNDNKDGLVCVICARYESAARQFYKIMYDGSESSSSSSREKVQREVRSAFYVPASGDDDGLDG